MGQISDGHMAAVFPLTLNMIKLKYGSCHIDELNECNNVDRFFGKLCDLSDNGRVGEYLNDLAALEFVNYEINKNNSQLNPVAHENYILNPSLEILSVKWDVLDILLSGKTDIEEPRSVNGYVLAWKNPKTGKVLFKEANNEELLILKMMAEDIAPEDISADNEVPVSIINKGLRNAVSKGIVLSPRSRLERDISIFDNDSITEKALLCNIFTLQWHITHACDLSCKHCYDRSSRSPLTLEQGAKILEDLSIFTRDRFVDGHVCFTGGNPFMYPDFEKLYSETVYRGFSTSILGNPVDRARLKRISDIRKPTYFQVSLEGLKEHNDHIRGSGHYDNVFEFLDILKTLNISSAVMLTLTKDNLAQVLPLAEKLKGRAEYFTFNRLSRTGEGADLELPSKEDYCSFIRDYIEASKKNPILGFKDNLINIALKEEGDKLFSGCTGFGCGAAFNFVTILPDGEVHACRKFPSLIGNILEDDLSAIYDSRMAGKYRKGALKCNQCSLRHVCGGCLAVADGCNIDIFKEKDPFCWFDNGAGKY